MRLVFAGLEKQGIVMDHPRLLGAHVPRPLKRDLLQQLEEQFGPMAVLRLSDAVPDMPEEPVVLALRCARDLPDLLERWRRVEVFSHGSNRVLCNQLDAGVTELKHVGPTDAAQPSQAESLLVLSVMTRLAELTSRRPVDVKLSDGQVLWRDGVWHHTDLVQWDGAVTLSLSDAEVASRSVNADPEKLLDVCKDLLLEDPVRRWSVDELAAETGVSSRTLQRRFAEASITFSGLVSETRLQKAASYLCDKEGPGLAETGFLSGFTDQAHFSRSFKKQVGTTPSNYRKSFAA